MSNDSETGADIPVAQPAPARARRRVRDSLREQRQPCDILVVDDNQANLIAIEAALAPLGRPLVLAHSGIEALGKILEQDFALIILDVAMPGMDGFETAKMVRSRDRNRATPIIFVTGLSCGRGTVDVYLLYDATQEVAFWMLAFASLGLVAAAIQIGRSGQDVSRDEAIP